MRHRVEPREAATSRRSAVALSLAAALLAAGSSACASAEHAATPATGAPTEEASTAAATGVDADEVRDAREAVEDARRGLAYAKADREVAGLEVETAGLESAEKERGLRSKLERARTKLAAFREVEMGIERDDAELEVEDARDSLLTAETDLAGLEDIFAEEAEASAKPEILRRGRRRVERARTRLSMQERRSALALEREIPMKLAELEDDVIEAEAALAAFQSQRKIDGLEARLKLQKAADAVAAAERDLERAEEELAELPGAEGDEGDAEGGDA